MVSGVDLLFVRCYLSTSTNNSLINSAISVVDCFVGSGNGDIFWNYIPLLSTASTNQIQIYNGTYNVALNVPIGSMTQNSVISLPSPLAATDTIVLESQTQTLSNKTLASPAFSGLCTGYIQSTTQYCAEVNVSTTVSGVTGSGNTVTIPFNGVVYASNTTSFNTSTYIFTAPATGIYHFELVYTSDGYVSANNHINLTFAATISGTSTSYNMLFANPGTMADVNGYLVTSLCRNISMSTNDTVYAEVSVSGNTSNNVNIIGGLGNTSLIINLITGYA